MTTISIIVRIATLINQLNEDRRVGTFWEKSQ